MAKCCLLITSTAAILCTLYTTCVAQRGKPQVTGTAGLPERGGTGALAWRPRLCAWMSHRADYFFARALKDRLPPLSRVSRESFASGTTPKIVAKKKEFDP